jgi:Na+/phosphate symporter
MITNTLKVLTTEELEAELNERRQQEATEREQKRNEYESLKSSVINELAPYADQLSTNLMSFKKKAFDELGTLFDLLKDYSKRHQDGKGNFKIEDENFKIQFKRQGKGTFDERSHQAEKHIIDFLSSKYKGDLDTKDLIMSLLERKNGALDILLVQKLYSMEDRFDDDNWREGIKLLKESYSFSLSKDYVSFFKKNSNNEWEGINLNFSY